MSKMKLLPPRGFKPVGPIERVSFSPVPPPFVHEQKRRGRRLQGIKYESKVHEHFLELYPDYYVPSPWFRFWEIGNDRMRWCQPDGLIILPTRGQIIIVECKLQHTSDAWWQLRWLYMPVISQAFPQTLWKYGVCEVVKWFDPATSFPERVKMKANVLDTAPGEFGVHIWKL